MKQHSDELSPRYLARIAGLWYLILTACSIFGVMYVNTQIYVPGDAAATAARIMDNESLYRMGIVSGLAGQASFVFVGLAFYRLFKSVDLGQARALLALVIAAVPVAFLDMLNKFAPLILLGDPAFQTAFDPSQLQALAMLFILLEKYGILIVGLFWGLWLMPLGILTYKSGFLPRLLGILLMINCVAYLADTVLAILAPDLRTMITPVMIVFQIIGEIPFLLWLLIRGAKNPRPTELASPVV